MVNKIAKIQKSKQSSAWREGYHAAKWAVGNDELSPNILTEAMANLIDVPLGLKNAWLVYERLEGFSCGLLEIRTWPESNTEI